MGFKAIVIMDLDENSKARYLEILSSEYSEIFFYDTISTNEIEEFNEQVKRENALLSQGRGSVGVMQFLPTLFVEEGDYATYQTLRERFPNRVYRIKAL